MEFIIYLSLVLLVGLMAWLGWSTFKSKKPKLGEGRTATKKPPKNMRDFLKNRTVKRKKRKILRHSHQKHHFGTFSPIKPLR